MDNSGIALTVPGVGPAAEDAVHHPPNPPGSTGPARPGTVAGPSR